MTYVDSLGSASFRLLQTIDLKGRYPLAIELSLLPGIGASNGQISDSFPSVPLD
jgi:hypothetical protein